MNTIDLFAELFADELRLEENVEDLIKQYVYSNHWFGVYILKNKEKYKNIKSKENYG